MKKYIDRKNILNYIVISVEGAMGNISLRGLIFVIMFFFLISVGVFGISTCGKKTSVDSVISNSIPQLRSPSHKEPEKPE